MSKEYSPEVVGQSFIKQYYEMFAKNPSELHRFYKDESSFSHAEGHQVISSVSSIESIRDTIAQLGLTGCRLDLSEGSIDAQRSEQGGVFLVVTGNLMLPGKPYHHFVQSFFLACQSNKGTAPSYYVRNSIFRLLGVVQESVSETSEIEQTIIETVAPVSTSSSPNTTTTTPITTKVVESEVHQSPILEQVNEIVENTSSPSPTPEVQEQEEQEETQMNGFDDVHVDHNTIVSEPDYVNVSIPENNDSQNEEDQQDENDGGYTSTSSSRAGGAHRSFAELVKGWGDQGRSKTSDSTQGHTKSKSKSSKASNHGSSSSSNPNPNSSTTNNTSSSTTTTTTTAAAAAATNTTTESNSPQVVSQTVQEKGSSSNHHHHHYYNSPSALYLNQLPEEVTTPDQLSHLFTPYGSIRKIDVHPKGYAFVNYYDAAVVAKVLEIVATTPEVFSINGKVIQVKEKLNKPKSTGGKDKKVGEKVKKEGWKPKGLAATAAAGGNSPPTTSGGTGGGAQGEKVHTGEKKSFNRNKTEKAQIAKVSKK